jgi:O-methyltransferase involved in polyketide biosynthesis
MKTVSAMPTKVAVDLDGVPETLLVTLYNRAVESQRPDPILRDEQAVRWVAQIDYDFSPFGDGRITHPIRGIAHNRAKLYAKHQVTAGKSLTFVRLPT